MISLEIEKISIYPDIRKHLCILSSIFLGCLIFACSGSKPFQTLPPIADDRIHIPQPKESKINPYAEYFDKQVTEQIEQSFDLSRQLRNLFSKRKQALNVDAFGEVPNSSWFTNRNAHKRLTLVEIARGANTGTGPDTSGVWIVTKAKAEGVTPGFSIKDIKGDNYTTFAHINHSLKNNILCLE